MKKKNSQWAKPLHGGPWITWQELLDRMMREKYVETWRTTNPYFSNPENQWFNVRKDYIDAPNYKGYRYLVDAYDVCQYLAMVFKPLQG